MTRAHSADANQSEIASIATDLAKIATDEIRHLYMGACPDQVDGHHLRDDECPACQILMRYDAIE